MIMTAIAAIVGFVLGRRSERIKTKNRNPHPVYIAGCDEIKNDCGPIEIGQLYELKQYNDDPFERGKHPVRVMDIKEGYVLYRYEHGHISNSTQESSFRESFIKL